jgi:hypothetical protein
VPPDGVDVALLVDGFRRDALAPVAPDDIFEDLAQVLRLVDRCEYRVDGARIDLVATLDELAELVDHRAGLGDVGVGAFDRQPVPAQQDRAAEPVAEGVQDTVAHRRELGRDVVRD